MTAAGAGPQAAPPQWAQLDPASAELARRARGYLDEVAPLLPAAERAIRDNSIKRIGQPGDVAAAVLYLASPQAGFVTGEVIHVSGGRFG